MSRQPEAKATSQAGTIGPIEAIILPRPRDLGGFEVRRVLPAVQRRMIGPFIFWDQIGPATLAPGTGIDVRPHPHIGLATVTYLFEGEIVHRDSLGTVQTIRPGEVNWMTAGRGIAHSERTAPALKQGGSRAFGIQSWVALPKRDEETEPAFGHYGQDELPVIEGEGKTLRLIAGSLFGKRSPVKTFSEMFFADVALEAGARLTVPAEHEERAVHVAQGTVTRAGQSFDAGQMAVLRSGDEIMIEASSAARILLLGGAPMDGPRRIWWNFVSSSQERIEQAKADWKEGRFPRIPGDDKEFIPLPE